MTQNLSWTYESPAKAIREARAWESMVIEFKLDTKSTQSDNNTETHQINTPCRAQVAPSKMDISFVMN